MNKYRFLHFNKFIRVVAFLIFLGVGIACSHKTKVESVETVEQVKPDPVAEVKAAVTRVADSIATLRNKGELGKVKSNMPEKFKTADEAITYMKNSGKWDKYKDGILPEVARQDISYADKLLHSTFPYFVISDKGTMRATLYDQYGKAHLSFPMACSRYFGTKHKFRDNRTPEGFFSAQGIYDSREWLYTDDDGNTSQAKGVYGPRFMRLKTPVTLSVGIHGTNSPGSPGSRCSHGCMRLLNKNAWELMKYTQKGMPIIVNPSSRDNAVNKEEGYHVTMLRLGKVSDSYVADVKLPEAKPDEKKEETPQDELENGQKTQTEESQPKSPDTEEPIVVPTPEPVPTPTENPE